MVPASLIERPCEKPAPEVVKRCSCPLALKMKPVIIRKYKQIGQWSCSEQQSMAFDMVINLHFSLFQIYNGDKMVSMKKVL